MAWIEAHFRAMVLVKMTSLYVLLPDGPGPFPVLYLLHGLSDDHSGWLRRTGLERHMDNVPMIVAMPDAHRSFYVNNPAPGGSPYEDHIIKDVIGFVDTTFRTIPQRGARAVAGMSMGGYGAMMLGFKHADLFSVACSHSGAVGAFHHPRPEVPLLQDLSSAIDISQYDCFALAQKQKERPAGELAIRIDCGDKDFLLQDNRDFHAHLEQLGIAHSYAEFPGDHNWAYWDVHIQDTIRFIRQKLPALQGQE